MNSKRWCILRTSGPNTLGVANSLGEAGFEVWTPVDTIKRQKPRSKRIVEHQVPVMPSYVFAGGSHLPDLLAIANAPISPYPAFSVFRHLGRPWLIPDGSLNPLRVAERRTNPAQHMPTFMPGEHVRVMEGVGTGMVGVVERAKGKFTLVCFPHFKQPIIINNLILSAEEVETAQLHSTAAKAA